MEWHLFTLYVLDETMAQSIEKNQTEENPDTIQTDIKACKARII